MAKLRNERRLLSEINVTPFVDVALVLLIIFMVTTPLMQEGIDVNLPKEKGKEITLTEKTVISIKADKNDPATGKIFLNDVQLTLEMLETELKSKNLTGNQQAFIRADEGIPYGYVVKVMAVAKETGINNVGLVVTPK
ncbi:MAG: biopolymer transporter ExbD [Nitrospinae bacterium]|nr:biopolymer transporter ExbD [Nitrospinota bacterium]